MQKGKWKETEWRFFVLSPTLPFGVFTHTPGSEGPCEPCWVSTSPKIVQTNPIGMKNNNEEWRRKVVEERSKRSEDIIYFRNTVSERIIIIEKKKKKKKIKKKKKKKKKNSTPSLDCLRTQSPHHIFLWILKNLSSFISNFNFFFFAIFFWFCWIWKRNGFPSSHLCLHFCVYKLQELQISNFKISYFDISYFIFLFRSFQFFFFQYQCPSSSSPSRWCDERRRWAPDSVLQQPQVVLPPSPCAALNNII